MPRGGANNIRVHTCRDGQVRRVDPVYFREQTQPGKRNFKRMTWFCYMCRYSDGVWEPEERLNLSMSGREESQP